MAFMYLSIFDSAGKAAGEALSIDPASLYRAFEHVVDGRKARGKRYPFPLLLTLLLLGKLAGETTVNGIVDWIQERQGWLRRQLNWPKRFPTNSTYSEALARCDAQEIATVIANVLLKARAGEQCGSEPSRLQAHKQEETLTHVAMDGKTLRGTLGHESEAQPSVHLLALYECQSGIVLTQRAVRSKENEISAAAALVHPALVKGRIISTDAMHTQKKWCACVHGYAGYYLTIVKKNQPGNERSAVHRDLGGDDGRDDVSCCCSNDPHVWCRLRWQAPAGAALCANLDLRQRLPPRLDIVRSVGILSRHRS
jgi:predicted transposase YbfD/YdcC